jgi:uncharacterized membrane protein YdjX (TVP38/TMEM64 family)
MAYDLALLPKAQILEFSNSARAYAANLGIVIIASQACASFIPVSMPT